MRKWVIMVDWTKGKYPKKGVHRLSKKRYWTQASARRRAEQLTAMATNSFYYEVKED